MNGRTGGCELMKATPQRPCVGCHIIPTLLVAIVVFEHSDIPLHQVRFLVRPHGHGAGSHKSCRIRKHLYNSKLRWSNLYRDLYRGARIFDVNLNGSWKRGLGEGPRGAVVNPWFFWSHFCYGASRLIVQKTCRLVTSDLFWFTTWSSGSTVFDSWTKIECLFFVFALRTMITIRPEGRQELVLWHVLDVCVS